MAPDDRQALEHVAGYVVTNPLSLQRTVYLDGQHAVIDKGLSHNPTLAGTSRRWIRGSDGEDGGDSRHFLLQPWRRMPLLWALASPTFRE